MSIINEEGKFEPLYLLHWHFLSQWGIAASERFSLIERGLLYNGPIQVTKDRSAPLAQRERVENVKPRGTPVDGHVGHQ